MTVLIDPPNSPGHGRLWSHLASDRSFAELHEFAGRLGVPARGFDRDHYDVPAERYDAVVALGAVAVSSRELIERLDSAGLRRRKRGMLQPRPVGRALVRPRRLTAGDTVAVVSPAGPVTAERLDAGVEVLRSWGLEVVELPASRGRLEEPDYLAAEDGARAADLMAAWADPRVTAVLCTRGGYGAHRVVDLLDWHRMAAAGAKVLVGFSDVTALHQAFAARLGVATIHGPGVAGLALDRPDPGHAAAVEHLRRTLFQPERATTLTPEPAVTVRPGRTEGVLVGGNLAVLAASVGTPTAHPAGGGIAVLEDVGEPVYRLDRMVTQLLRAGWFDGVRGIALGRFSGCGDEEAVLRVFEGRLRPLGVPMIAEVPVGHVAGNLALPLGVRALLDADAGTLSLRDPALA